MKKAAVLADVATFAVAGTAQAQVCAGFPSSDRGFYFGARADFPEDLDSFGVEANYNAAGPLSVFGGLNVVSYEDIDDSDYNVYTVGAAFETPSIGAMVGPRVSACPVVSVSFTDDSDNMQIPIGLGIGASLGSPVGPEINGYVQPALVISRFEGLGDDTETETDFGLKAGAMVGLGLITVGAEVGKVFSEGNDFVFGIRAGIAL